MNLRAGNYVVEDFNLIQRHFTAGTRTGIEPVISYQQIHTVTDIDRRRNEGAGRSAIDIKRAERRAAGSLHDDGNVLPCSVSERSSAEIGCVAHNQSQRAVAHEEREAGLS